MEAGESGLLGLHVGAPGSADIELRLVVIQLDLEIAVEIPVDADAGIARFACRRVRIGKASGRRPGKSCGVDGLHAISRHQLHCAQSGAAYRIRPAWRWIAERGIFAGHDPVAVDLPRLAVEVLLLVCRPRYFLTGIDVFAEQAERSDVIVELRGNLFAFAVGERTRAEDKEVLLADGLVRRKVGSRGRTLLHPVAYPIPMPSPPNQPSPLPNGSPNKRPKKTF